MTIKYVRKWTLALALVVIGAAVALAAVIIDDDGVGFVGKGDVQLVYGWNNKQLQDNAELVQFRAILVEETTWTCKRHAGEQTQERARTTTIQQLVSSVARLKNQVTGFNLNGYTGDPTVVATEGPAIGSCPSGWSVIEGPTTSPVEDESGVEVSINGTDWTLLQ